MKICFATNNRHKLVEIERKLGKAYDVISLSSLGHTTELPETHDTLEGNSLEKAQYVYNKYQIDCFADDTGLLVDALNGEPGVNSARYAGADKNAEKNIQMLLHRLGNNSNRKAKFVTVISLIVSGEVFQFSGEVNGIIARKKTGSSGFGYDPLFIPDGWQRTFAELDLDEKNQISHRGKAIDQLVAFLKTRGMRGEKD
jgi:XTP/dITP diphosphohydrolase